MPPTDAEQTRWFAEEVQPHEPALRAYLRGCFPTLNDVDDLIQDAYTRLLRAREAGKVEHTKAYLFATARNAALDLFRRKQVVPMESIEGMEDSTVLRAQTDVAETVSHGQDLELLRAAIDSLPPRCREILTMRKLRGMSYAAIAETLGVSESTVNAQLALGVARCRRYLLARGVEKGAADASRI